MSEEQNNNRERREFERGNNFDVFVSYRRSDGKSFAKTLNLAFKNEGFRCFLDYSDLEGGDFRRQLQDAVVDAPVFVMVMTPDYFARCVKKVETADGKTVFEPNEDDWVRREIDLALSNGKIIIPINMNGILKGTPDYLDEDFGNRVSSHQFSSVYDDDTFDSSFAGMLAKNIWNRFSKLEKPTDKAMVTVATDADCKLMKNNQLLATLQADEHSPILLGKGNHLLQARSEEFPQISVNVIKKIEDVSCDDFIKIELADKVHRLKEEEAERIEREKREAEQREEEVEQREEEVELRKAERKAWWQRHKSKFAIALAVIALYVTGLLIYLNWDYSLKTITEHSKYVNSVCWSPDGKYLASGSGDETLIIWNANSGQRLKTLKGHSESVRSVCWSPDGKHLASGSRDKTVIIWDAESGEKLKTLEGHSHWVKSVSWSPDGKYLASGSQDGSVIIWDAESGEKLKTLAGHYYSVYSVSWSPDGKYLASGAGDAFVIIWDAESGEKLKTLAGHYYSVYSVSWSPDGKYLASGSGDKTLIIWDAKSGEKLKTLKGHSSFVESVCWSPDGKYLASGSYDKTLIIWDAKSGEKLKTLKGHSDEVSSVCWSPDGKYLASGSWDNTVKIWGVE